MTDNLKTWPERIGLSHGYIVAVEPDYAIHDRAIFPVLMRTGGIAMADAEYVRADLLESAVKAEDDPVLLWAEIHRLRYELKGPEGFETWKEAAIAERLRANAPGAKFSGGAGGGPSSQFFGGGGSGEPTESIRGGGGSGGPSLNFSAVATAVLTDDRNKINLRRALVLLRKAVSYPYDAALRCHIMAFLEKMAKE